ncbi:TolB family protein [Nonomuraea cavernae]|uniref:Uncharacterized protein n=1 Tax=Nonomuraea cavernae TaxID=2045107 RepID=A0A917ZK11_9ACTN|nr:kelch repeat-containing protein [Nonomuraea cavernae]MCA2186642.1 hypothetical protein [Nonomuraea cavernae]GGO83237.1 hypothetical protein GCM10012289_76260 [Nonomuraea cavernae]
MNDLEETLRRTLGHAAGQAPPAPDRLAEAVEAGYRRRRHRGQALLAAGAVVLLAGGAAIALRGETLQTLPATVPTETPSAVSTTPPPPIEQVWPQAVRTLPVKLPGGRTIREIRRIDDHTLLVTTWSRFERTNAVYAYDLDTRKLRKIADVPTPRGTVLYASGFEVGGGRVLWWTALEGGKGQIWSAPLAGGQAEIVVTHPVDDGGFDALEVAGDRIVFSVRAGGVFTAPLGGGPAEPVEGGTGMHLLAWPWIGPSGGYGPTDEPRFGSIRNVETGETDTAVTQVDEKHIVCGLTFCVGAKPTGPSFHRLRDGSGEQKLPGGMHPLALPGRFHTASVLGEGPRRQGLGVGRQVLGAVLYDMTTGKSADLGVRPEDDGLRMSYPDNRRPLLVYTVGDQLRVIDLTRIP